MPIKAENICDGGYGTSIPLTVSPYDDQQQPDRPRMEIANETLMAHNQEYMLRQVYYLPHRFLPNPYGAYSLSQSPASSASEWIPHDLSLKGMPSSSMSASDCSTLGPEDNSSNNCSGASQRTAQLTFTPDCVIYDEAFQRMLRCLGAEERKSLDDLLNLLAHRIHSIADPAPSFPTDPRPLSVKQLRKYIPLLRMYAYPTPGPVPQRQKIKHIWEEKPADWPSDVIFRDPNNNRKGGKKPSKSELVKMYNFLYARHKLHERDASYTSTTGGAVRPANVRDAAVPSVDDHLSLAALIHADRLADSSWLAHHAGMGDGRVDDEESDGSDDEDEEEGGLAIAGDYQDVTSSAIRDVTAPCEANMNVKPEAVDIKAGFKREQEAAIHAVKTENYSSASQQATSMLLGKRKLSSSWNTSSPVSKKNSILQRWQSD